MEGTKALSASLLLDEQAKVIDGNREAEVFLGCPLEDARKKPLERLNAPLYQALKDLLEKARRGRGVENYSFAYKLGRRLTRLMVSVTPYPLEALGSVGTLVTIRGEAMARRPALLSVGGEEVEIGEKRGIRGFLQLLPEPAFVLDEEGNFLFVNQALCRLIGHTPEDVLGRPLSFFLGRGYPPGTQERLLEASLLAPWRGELQLQGAGGNRIHLRATCSLFPVEGNDGSCFLFLAWECGDEVRIRREREGEIKRLWGRLDATDLGIVAFTPDRRITAINSVAEEALAVGREVAIGSLLEEVFPLEKEILAEALEAAEKEGWSTFNLSLPGYGEGQVVRYKCKMRKVEGGDPRAPETVILMAPVVEAGTSSEEGFEGKRWWEERFYSHYLENMLQGDSEAAFFARALEVFEEEGVAEAGAVLMAVEGGLQLAAAFGFDLRERERLAGLRPRGEALNLWTFSSFLEVTFLSGVPQRGWDEARTLFEDPEGLSRLAGERRWKRLAIFPLSRKKSAAVLLFGGLQKDPDEILPMISALVKARSRAAGLWEEKIAPAGNKVDGGSASDPVVRREGQGKPEGSEKPEDRHGLMLISSSGDGVLGESQEGSSERKHENISPQGELLLKAREAKGDDPAEELPLWSKKSTSPSAGLLDLGDFARRMRGRLRELHGDSVLFEVEEDLPRVYLDGKALEDLLIGLVDEVVRAARPGSPVVFGMERWGDEILFRVECQDEGLSSGPEGDEGTGEPPFAFGRRGVQERLRLESVEVELRPYEELARKVRGSLTFKSVPGEGSVAYLRVGIIPFLGQAEA